MIGCLLGLAGALALARVAVRRHRTGFGGCGGPWHHHRHAGGWNGRWHRGDGWGGEDEVVPGGGPGGGPWSFRGRRAGVVLGALGERLDTTPEQDKAIRDAFEELKDEAARHRGEVRRTRADLAAALRKPSFDEVLLGELFARHDTALENLRKAVVGALAKTHLALDERQRLRLADLIESGPGLFSRWV